MLETFKAKLHGNRIIWSEETPDSVKEGDEVEVIVTILSKEPERSPRRPFGLAKGEFVVPDDFDGPLPDEVLADFEN